MKYLALFLLLSPSAEAFQCLRTPEYQAALEFIQAQEELMLSQNDLKQIAKRVSEGCGGASERFVRVTRLLVRSGMSAKEAIHNAMEFADKTDLQTDTFVAIFEGSFAAEYLELDLRSAIGLAHSLSTALDGDLLAAKADYEKLLNFCVGGKNIDLPRNKCAVFAARLAQLSVRWSVSLATPFIEVFKYLRSDSGAKLATQEALRLAEDLVSAGPVSPTSFIKAFEYATNKQRGLGMSVQDAIAFARRMAVQNQAFAPSQFSPS